MNKEHLEYIAKGKTISAKTTRASKLLAKGEITSFTVWGESDGEGSQVNVYYDSEEGKFYSLTTMGRKRTTTEVATIYSILCFSTLDGFDEYGIELHYTRSTTDIIAKHLTSTGKFNY